MDLNTFIPGFFKRGNKNSQFNDIDDLLEQLDKHPHSQQIKSLLKDSFKKDPVGFMSGLVRHQHSMYKKDLQDWLDARDYAMNVHNPDRLQLVEFYTDLECDPFIYGIVHNKRILKVSNKKFRIVNEAGEENPEATKLLRTQWFNDFIKMSLQSKFHGYSLIYFSEWKNGLINRTKLVYREHVKPQKGIVCKDVNDTDGIDYSKPPYANYMIGVGDPEDLGLYEKAAILYILRKHSWGNWDEFEEKFGIPILWAKTASQDKKVKAEIQKWLKDMGSSSWGLFPQDSELNVLDSTKVDAFQVFNEKRKAANEELEILLTGQKRVTQENGTYGKEKAMLTESEEVVDDDKAFIFQIVNNELLPRLRMNGYKIADNESFEWDETRQLTPQEKLLIYQGIDSMGFELDPEELQSEFGITILGKKEPAVQPPIPGSKKDKSTKEPNNKWEEFMKMHSDINQLYKDVH